MMERDRRVLWVLKGVVLGMPLFLGGRQPLAVTLAAAVVVALLVITLRERRHRNGPQAPGTAALAAFAALGLATTVPLPPAVLAWLAPATFRLYTQTLPGWPGADSWSVWRPLAIVPYGAWVELSRLAVSFGVFTVLVAYPWGDPDEDTDGAREHVFVRLVLTLLGGGALLAAIALVGQVAGNGSVLWITDMSALPGRASGPFVNPNHFAAWIEMILPTGVAYTWALYRRMHRRLAASADAGLGIGVSTRRAWVAALVVHQRSLWPPLVAAATVLLMLVAHVASGSRGGTAALCVGLGVMGVGVLTQRAARVPRGGIWRWLPLAVGALLLVASAASIVGWATAGDGAHASGNLEGVDVSLSSRLAVSATGWQIVRDFPTFGTGLGSWLHAFRPYVRPPVEGGIWDHAHDDFLELMAETGLAGFVLALLFALAVVRAARRVGGETPPALARHLPDAFRRSDWSAALRDPRVRWGLAGGVAAILVHSLVDFGLRMPANLVLLMVVLALLVLSGRPRSVGGGAALALLPVLLAAPLIPQATNAVLVLVGGTPLAPRDCLEAADLLLAQEGDAARPRAVALVEHALDRSPADCDAHAALASTLGAGPAGDEALRRALALDPWSAELRDQLGLRLLARGEEAAGTAELEESMYRLPSLISHAYLSPDLEPEATDPGRLVQALIDGDTIAVRLAALEPAVAGAVERGLARALADEAAGDNRRAIVNDHVTLLEARARWHDAAAALSAEAEGSADDASGLARAAHDYLQAEDSTAAEGALLAAVVHAPDSGDLYRDLAVEVYAARGDFPMAERVLHAGEHNAVDLLPVYDGLIEVLQRREAVRTPSVAVASAADDFREEPVP